MSSNQGWFDAFRDNGGIFLYSTDNRTAAVEDVRNILIYTTFATLFIAFLIIFPGIRKERLSTFICVTVSLFVGAVILVANFGTNWHVAEANISSPYRAFSKEKISAKVAVKVGLQSVNITLKANAVHKNHEDINYNERFFWIGPTEMKQEYQNALAKGLPFPILTIAEYLSQSGEGFCWGRRYRLAGYYSTILLWVAFSSWILMNILLCAVPRYGVFAMQITGAIMLLANAVYAILLPRKPLSIPFEGGTLAFAYGWCFWINLIAGIIALLVGATVSIIDTLFPNKFSTILEVDYDTPYRYFVGNDAHLFGGLAMINANTCPHISQSNTNSAVTESTCCIASSTRGHSKSNLTVGSGTVGSATVSSKILTSKRSDASVSTVMSIPVKKMNSLQKQKSDAIAIDSKQVTTTADIELTNVGIENKAFEKEHDSHDSDSSEVSTTIIDGKRAVSLANFGKFQRQQTIEAQKEGRVPTTPNTANAAFWY